MVLLGADQAADLLHLNVKRIQALARSGKLPGRRVGRKWLFDRRDLDRLLGLGPSAARPSVGLAISAGNQLRARVLGIVVALTSLLAASPPAAPAAPRTITVFAAASLTDAFTELGGVVECARPGLAVRFNFAGSQQLVAQLEHGAEADVFASADQRWMQRAVELGLVGGRPAVFAQNRMVVLLPASNPAHIGRLQDLARPGVKVVLAAEAVPAGRYAREQLERLESAPGMPAGFARAVLANVVSSEENVRTVVARVQLGEADAGLAYRSDVTPQVAPHVRVLEIPDGWSVAAAYPVAVLAGSSHQADARAFVDTLLGPTGRRILERHGLLAPPGP